MQTRSPWWPLWLGRIRPVQASNVRKLLMELPLIQLHTDSALSDFLDRFEALLPVSTLNLMLDEEGPKTSRCGSIRPCPDVTRCPLAELPATDSVHRCMACRQRGKHRLLCAIAAQADTPWCWLLLDTPRAADASWRRLLSEVALGVGFTLRTRGYRREQQRKQATAQHGALARELHDSVAQQLGYLSFQARVLHSQINTPEQAGVVLEELRSGLSQLQRQVRELITSARLTMDGRSLRQALADSVAEFSRRCIIVFELDNRLADDALSPETELQVLQIIREALANAVRHSHARHVRIELRQHPGGEVWVSVEDDGIGLSPASGEENHFGLSIIRERAASIGARLSIDAIRPHGVRVHLAVVGHPEVPEGSYDAEHHLTADR